MSRFFYASLLAMSCLGPAFTQEADFDTIKRALEDKYKACAKLEKVDRVPCEQVAVWMQTDLFAQRKTPAQLARELAPVPTTTSAR